VPQFSSALELYRHQVKAFEATTGTARQVWRQIPEGGYRDLKELTSGGISSRELARRGHPYARLGSGRRGTSKSYAKRFGRGEAPLLPINNQTARLNRSVTLYRRSSAYTLEESVGFDSAKAGPSIYAVSPQGTRYVVPRGIWVELNKRGRARAKAFNDVFPNLQRRAFSTP
jgi:hypothetical protein